MGTTALRKSLSVVIPAFNEAARIAATLDEIRRYAAGAFARFEIVVVDDSSRDATAEIVASLQGSVPQIRLLRFPVNRGKGASVGEGMRAASSELLLMCDADLSTPIGEMETLLPWIGRGADVVIGSRALKDSRVQVRQPLHRESMGKLFGVAMRTMTGVSFRDTQCGFKLFTRQAARRIFGLTRISRFAFDVEVMVIARATGLKVEEVPVAWSNTPDTKVRLFGDSLSMACDLVRISINDRTGAYRQG